MRHGDVNLKLAAVIDLVCRLALCPSVLILVTSVFVHVIFVLILLGSAQTPETVNPALV